MVKQALEFFKVRLGLLIRFGLFWDLSHSRRGEKGDEQRNWHELAQGQHLDDWCLR